MNEAALDVLRDLVAKVNEDYQFLPNVTLAKAQQEWAAIVDRANAVLYFTEEKEAA